MQVIKSFQWNGFWVFGAMVLLVAGLFAGWSFGKKEKLVPILPPPKGATVKLSCEFDDKVRNQKAKFPLELSFKGDKKQKGSKKPADFRMKEFSIGTSAGRLEKESVMSKYYWQVLMDSFSYRMERRRNTLYRDELIGNLPKGFMVNWKKPAEIRVKRFVRTGSSPNIAEPELFGTFRVSHMGEGVYEVDDKKVDVQKFMVKAYYSKNKSNFHSSKVIHMNTDFKEIWYSPKHRLTFYANNVQEYPGGRKELTCRTVGWKVPNRPELSHIAESKEPAKK